MARAENRRRWPAPDPQPSRAVSDRSQCVARAARPGAATATHLTVVAAAQRLHRDPLPAPSPEKYAELSDGKVTYSQRCAHCQRSPTVQNMSNFRDLIARMAIDPEFARHARANPDAVARQYHLNADESQQL